VDGIEHHLLACPKIIKFWNTFFKWLKISMSMSFPVDTYDVLFGIPNPNKDSLITQLNYMMLQGTFYIYKTRQGRKIPDIYEYLITCKKALNMLQINMIDKGKEKYYEKVWAALHEVL
jgi:hypothetical protein